MSEYCLYRHTSPSGKAYVGITKQRPEYRWGKGRGYKGNEYFSRAILKYGWDNFQHTILLDGLGYEDACSAEIDLIAIHDSTNRTCGYNIESGGNLQKKCSEETRTKMSRAQTGKKASPEACAARSKALIGKKRSPETLVNMSKAHMGQKVSLEMRAALSKAQTGKKASPDARAAISQALTGRKVSEHTRRLIGEKTKSRPLTVSMIIHLNNIAKRRSVEQLDTNGNVIARFCSMAEAAASVGSDRSAMWKACNGRCRKHKKYMWRYYDENI